MSVEVKDDILFGFAAGALSKYVEYPGDVVKVMLQCQPHGISFKTKTPGAIDCLRYVWSGGGLRGLCRGVSAPVLASALETSSLFTTYHLAKDILRNMQPREQVPGAATSNEERLPIVSRLVCAAIAGGSTSFLLTPLEFLKCNMQIPPPNIHRQDQSQYSVRRQGYGSIIVATVRNYGVGGFWRGQFGTMIRETGGTAAWFGTYETVSDKLRYVRSSMDPDQVNFFSLWHSVIAGGAAGVAYNIVCYPADTIKARMQTVDAGLSQSAVSFMAVGRQILREHGIRGLYRGCGVAVCCIAPGSAAIFLIYDGLRYASTYSKYRVDVSR